MTTKSPSRANLRLLVPASNIPTAGAPTALTRTSAKGVSWHLHAGLTKTGKLRYFVAQTSGEGAIAAMSAGYEFRESINGVVSVAKIDPNTRIVPSTDVDCVGDEIARHSHLRWHRVDVVKGEIVVFEPVGGYGVESLETLAETLGISTQILERRHTSRYAPVMKFVPIQDDAPVEYMLQRMGYSGHAGWRHVTMGPLPRLVQSCVHRIGTDAFFEML